MSIRARFQRVVSLAIVVVPFHVASAFSILSLVGFVAAATGFWFNVGDWWRPLAIVPGVQDLGDRTLRCRLYRTAAGLRDVPEPAWIEQAFSA